MLNPHSNSLPRGERTPSPVGEGRGEGRFPTGTTAYEPTFSTYVRTTA